MLANGRRPGGWGKGKFAQITQRQIPNAGGREVILFGPRVGGAVEKALKKEGIKVFKNAESLSRLC